MQELNVDNDEGKGELEELIRQSVPHELPAGLRVRILQDLEARGKPKVLRFSMPLSAAAAVTLLAALYFYVKPGQKTGGHPTVVETTGELLHGNPDELVTLSETTTRMALRPIGEVVDAGGHPVRLFEAHEIMTVECQDPATGVTYLVSTPTKRYQIGRPNIL